MSRETLKAIIVILITILASNAASSQESKRCALDAPLLSLGAAQTQSDYHRPDLASTAFTVEKMFSATRNNVAIVALQITDGREHFVVMRVLSPSLDFTGSYDPIYAKPGQPITWGQRDLRVEADERMMPLFSVDDGPLTLIALVPLC